MNSLVVFLSVMALAAAEPSAILPGRVISYSPAVLAQQYGVGASAVTHQSRVDIKSSPTVVSTEIVQPIARTVVAQPAVIAQPAVVAQPIARTVVAQPAVVAQPIARTVVAAPSYLAGPSYVAAPSYVASPLAYQTPLAYAAAPIAVAAPAAVSHQARLDIKSSPALVSTVATAPVFRTVIPAPALSYGAINYQTILNSAANAPVAIAGPAPAVAAVETEPQVEVQADSSAELPQAPSETPEVIAARAAHLDAKAEIEEAHNIKKRSLVVSAPLITSYATPITKYTAAPAYYPGYNGFYSTYPAAPIVRYL